MSPKLIVVFCLDFVFIGTSLVLPSVLVEKHLHGDLIDAIPTVCKMVAVVLSIVIVANLTNAAVDQPEQRGFEVIDEKDETD